MRWATVVFGALLVSAGLLAAPAVSASTAAQPTDSDEPSLQIELTADGDATVSMVSVYDLTDESEQAAFESLDADEDDQTQLVDRFADRLQSVAESADVDREMTVTAEAVDLQTSDDHGLVTLTVEWDSLAAVDDGQLTLTEPFASGYESDRTLVVTGPDGSTLESATPEPTSTSESQATWDDGADLDGFEILMTLQDTDDGAEADDSVPGFGVIALGTAMLAVLGAGIVSRHN